MHFWILLGFLVSLVQCAPHKTAIQEIEPIKANTWSQRYSTLKSHKQPSISHDKYSSLKYHRFRDPDNLDDLLHHIENAYKTVDWTSIPTDDSATESWSSHLEKAPLYVERVAKPIPIPSSSRSSHYSLQDSYSTDSTLPSLESASSGASYNQGFHVGRSRPSVSISPVHAEAYKDDVTSASWPRIDKDGIHLKPSLASPSITPLLVESSSKQAEPLQRPVTPDYLANKWQQDQQTLDAMNSTPDKNPRNSLALVDRHGKIIKTVCMDLLNQTLTEFPELKASAVALGDLARGKRKLPSQKQVSEAILKTVKSNANIDAIDQMVDHTKHAMNSASQAVSKGVQLSASTAGGAIKGAAHLATKVIPKPKRAIILPSFVKTSAKKTNEISGKISTQVSSKIGMTVNAAGKAGSLLTQGVLAGVKEAGKHISQGVQTSCSSDVSKSQQSDVYRYLEKVVKLLIKLGFSSYAIMGSIMEIMMTLTYAGYIAYDSIMMDSKEAFLVILRHVCGDDVAEVLEDGLQAYDNVMLVYYNALGLGEEVYMMNFEACALNEIVSTFDEPPHDKEPISPSDKEPITSDTTWDIHSYLKSNDDADYIEMKTFKKRIPYQDDTIDRKRRRYRRLL